jgi:hypothetical protein
MVMHCFHPSKSTIVLALKTLDQLGDNQASPTLSVSYFVGVSINLLFNFHM